MEIDKLIKKYEDKLIDIEDSRKADSLAGDHSFTMEYDTSKDEINLFIIDLKQFKALNMHCPVIIS